MYKGRRGYMKRLHSSETSEDYLRLRVFLNTLHNFILLIKKLHYV